jgi:hypothetical protein
MFHEKRHRLCDSLLSFCASEEGAGHKGGKSNRVATLWRPSVEGMEASMLIRLYVSCCAGRGCALADIYLCSSTADHIVPYAFFRCNIATFDLNIWLNMSGYKTLSCSDTATYRSEAKSDIDDDLLGSIFDTPQLTAEYTQGTLAYPHNSPRFLAVGSARGSALIIVIWSCSALTHNSSRNVEPAWVTQWHSQRLPCVNYPQVMSKSRRMADPLLTETQAFTAPWMK